jgi:hypothetical protein
MGPEDRYRAVVAVDYTEEDGHQTVVVKDSASLVASAFMFQDVVRMPLTPVEIELWKGGRKVTFSAAFSFDMDEIYNWDIRQATNNMQDFIAPKPLPRQPMHVPHIDEGDVYGSVGATLPEVYGESSAAAEAVVLAEALPGEIAQVAIDVIDPRRADEDSLLVRTESGKA